MLGTVCGDACGGGVHDPADKCYGPGMVYTILYSCSLAFMFHHFHGHAGSPPIFERWNLNPATT